ncbi:MAG: hypothetical protein CMQ41_11850 [Gammaproteobacteria bacterium]|nr:hypothetical protein [Gammaproteobacteria bacterium]
MGSKRQTKHSSLDVAIMSKLKQIDLTTMKITKEPMLHFFAMASAIFLIYGISQVGNENILEIDQREIDARIFMQEMAIGQELSEEQRQVVASTYVEEQILVQEALTMGLDNDARIHDMLAQKMRHVLSGDVIQPSESEMEAYYQGNIDRYTSLPLVSVDELVLNTKDELSEELLTLLNNGSETETILAAAPGNNAPLPNVNRMDLSNIFSPEFSEAVFNSEMNTWVGPFPSNRGQHWLMVIERSEASLPPLEEILDRVRLDWIAEEEEALLQKEVDSLWGKYTIIVNDDEEEHL